jgi:hypothetical protein
MTEIMENEINGVIAQCVFQRPNDTSQYALGNVVSLSTTSATNLSWSVGTSSIMINHAGYINSDAAIPAGQSGLKLHLYNSAPTAIADNASYNLVVADYNKYIGYIQFDTPTDFGNTNASQNTNVGIVCKSQAGVLYGMLVTDTAFTASALTTISITLRGMQV